MNTQPLLQEAVAQKGMLQALRHGFHQSPELGSEIDKTAKTVVAELKKIGVDSISLDSGIVASLNGRRPGKTILLRADMDALPILEQTGACYQSQIPGKMHACGHDAHTTWLLGAAALLASRREQFSGTVKFLFQPCEEGKGGVGARAMIAAGVLENPHVDVALAAHVSPAIPVGKIGVAPGAVTATPGTFRITVNGKGGHGSEPHKCIDPIAVLHQIYAAFQGILRDNLSPEKPAVISVTTMNAGTAFNIIPDTAEMGGTIRTFGAEDNRFVAEKMEQAVHAICTLYGAQGTFVHEVPIGSCVNETEAAKLVCAAANVIGENMVVTPPPTMAGDDFCLFSDVVPSCYFFVGVGNEEKGIVHPLHSDRFALDEDCLPLAAATLAQAVLLFLGDYATIQ